MNGTTRLAAIFGTWGLPPDRPALVALLVAALLLVLAMLPSSAYAFVDASAATGAPSSVRRHVVAVLAFAAAFLSLGYVAFYLHAAPRIIDATSYFLEGRALSHGHFAWPIPTPSASFRGRFLLYQEATHELAVIFPPGFPLLLSLGFRLGAPLVVGPILGGAIVVATAWLAWELGSRLSAGDRHGVTLLAAALSVVSAALRYHTADTMAHGASALGVTVALAAALFGEKRGGRGPWLLAGLAVGWVGCTRPVSSLAIGVVVAFLAARRGRLVTAALWTLPGLALLVVASHAETGRWLASAQASYYAVSDGPPGCFRYGFGSEVGCLGEHKDFVLARLPHGFGVTEATLATLRRLRVHLLDVANLELLFPLVFVPLAKKSLVSGRARVAFAVVLLQIAAYAPFYFDGSYPGGGARFFADVLPVEHALLALGVAALFPAVALFRRGFVVLALCLAGFGVHAAFEHEALAERDGGAAPYDPEEGRVAVKGVLFVDTDGGFDLAYDPFADPSKSILAARLRGDDHDRMLVDRLGHPPAHVYRVEGKRGQVTAWSSRSSARDLWRFEAEADWPPLAQDGGWAEVVWASTSCATDGRVVTLHVEKTGGSPGVARARFDLPVPHAGKWIVMPRVMKRGGAGKGTLRLVPRGTIDPAVSATWVWEWSDADGVTAGKDVCADMAGGQTSRGVELDAEGAAWELTATGGDVTIDETSLRATR